MAVKLDNVTRRRRRGGVISGGKREKREGRFWFSAHPQLEMSVWIQLKCKMHKGAEEEDMCARNYRL